MIKLEPTGSVHGGALVYCYDPIFMVIRSGMLEYVSGGTAIVSGIGHTHTDCITHDLSIVKDCARQHLRKQHELLDRALETINAYA